MVYSKSTISDMQEYFRMNKNKKMGEREIIEFAELASSEEQFDDNIELVLVNNLPYPGFVDTENGGKIFVGVPTIKAIAKQMTYDNRLIEGDMTLAYNYWVIYFLMHELEHLHQYLEGMGVKAFEQKEIYQTYKAIFRKFEEYNSKIIRRYESEPLSFNHERNANMETSRVMVDIMNGHGLEDNLTLAHVNHLCYINSGYFRDKKGLVVCPMERTFKLMDMKKPLLIGDYDLETRFYHGMPISIDEYRSIFTKDDRPFSQRNYDEEIKRLKR